MRWATIILLPAVVAGCDEKPTPAQQAAADARAIAQVEAANRSYGPPIPLVPQPITTADLQRAGLLDAGCAFFAEGQADPVLVTRPKRAAMKFGRNLTSFASDPGGASLPLGTWAHYVGKAASLGIEVTGDGDPATQNHVEWVGRLTATDEHDRIVYRAEGKLRCGA